MTARTLYQTGNQKESCIEISILAAQISKDFSKEKVLQH
jgi:hypothetical protein